MAEGIKVDVAGFDIYNQMGVVKEGKRNTKGTDLNAAYFSKIEPWAKREGLVWGLGETGITHDAAEDDPGWIKRTFNQLDASWRSCVRLLQHDVEQHRALDLEHA